MRTYCQAGMASSPSLCRCLDGGLAHLWQAISAPGLCISRHVSTNADLLSHRSNSNLLGVITHDLSCWCTSWTKTCVQENLFPSNIFPDSRLPSMHVIPPRSFPANVTAWQHHGDQLEPCSCTHKIIADINSRGECRLTEAYIVEGDGLAKSSVPNAGFKGCCGCGGQLSCNDLMAPCRSS